MATHDHARNAVPPIDRPQHTRRGITLMMVGVAMFSIGDAAVKFLTTEYEIVQIVWARYMFHALLFLAIFSRIGLKRQITTVRPWLQFGRSILLLLATIFFFTAVRYLSLAEATSITFVSPLLVTAFSIPLLGERVRFRRWIAIMVGFVGVLIIVRPGLGVMHWAAILPLGTAVCYAFYQILTRIAARTEDSRTSLFWTSAVGAILTSAVVPFAWTVPSPFAWVLMIGTGLIFGFGHFLLIKGFEVAPASSLAPFMYTGLIWVTIIGYLLFGDFPDQFTILGGLIVIASGLYVWHRETRK